MISPHRICQNSAELSVRMTFGIRDGPCSSESLLKDNTTGVSSSNRTKKCKSWTHTCASSFVKSFFVQHVHWRSGSWSRVLALLFFFFRRGCWHCPGFGKRRTHPFSLFLSFLKSFARSHVSLRAHRSYFGFRFAFFPQILKPRNFLVKFAFLHESLRWNLVFWSFYVTHRALAKLDGVIWSQFPNFM